MIIRDNKRAAAGLHEHFVDTSYYESNKTRFKCLINAISALFQVQY